MRLENPYHEGELSVQERLGEVDEGRRNGRAISDSILKGALKYIEQQSLVVFGSLDQEDNVWASLLIGDPGFLRAFDERTVEINLEKAAQNRDDPLWSNFEQNSQVGMLVIDLGTRRRLRINGQLLRSSQEQLRLAVRESYPNCPKYIQRRRIIARLAKPVEASAECRHGDLLTHDQQKFIRSADTFFVASAHPERGVDASHRGGNPGFIRVLSDRMIRVPDYVGNRMYNTLGNFTVNPHAGLVFLDFERSRTLQLIGRPEIRWSLNDLENETGGTRRYWDFEIMRWLETNLTTELKWEFLDSSPENPSTAAG